MIRAALILSTLAVLIGCQPQEPDVQMLDKPTVYAEPPRFEVTRAQQFSDDLAYGNEHGIYIVRDKKTGQKYMGVSVIGISEKGRHRSGKSSTTDER
jgi:hypothetical protein